jgi:uncharacterized coiled-coil protein SlyX
MTGGGQNELYFKLGREITEYEPIDFVRKFIRYTCFLKTSLREGKYRPDKPLLTENEISRLSVDDIEAIAKLYVENNEYLLRESTWKTEKDDKNQAIGYVEYGEVKYPRKDEETYAEYLTRLCINEQKTIKEQMKQAFAVVNSFSRGLENQIKNTWSLGSSLRQTMKNIRAPQSEKPIRPEFQETDLSEIERFDPSYEVRERLDKLIEASAQAVEFIIRANEIQTRIAAEIKSSSDNTTKLSKKNIALSGVVILLTIINLSIFAWSTLHGNNIVGRQHSETQQNMNLLAEKLTDINNSIIKGNNETVDLLDSGKTLIKELVKSQNEFFESEVKNQENAIDELKRVVERQNKIEEQLEEKTKVEGSKE